MTRDWHLHAVCRVEDVDPETFYPHPTDNPADARAYCRRCPVVAECLNEALRVEGNSSRQYRAGIWGGLTPEQRCQIAARRQQQAAPARLTPAEENAAFLLDQGESVDGAAIRLGVRRQTVIRNLWRANREVTA